MMSTKKYRIRLTTDEQQELNALVSRGRAAAYKQTHARILLMSDESRSDGGMKDADITSALGVGQSTVERIRKRCVEEGVESALNRKKQLRRRQKRLDGEGEARLIAMACGEPPEGRASWTLKLLADQLVECEIVGTISTETVRQALKKKRTEAVAEAELVHPARSERGVCVRDGRRDGRRDETKALSSWRSTNGRTMGMRFWCAWMRRANSKSRRRECRVPQRPAYRRHTTTNTSAME